MLDWIKKWSDTLGVTFIIGIVGAVVYAFVSSQQSKIDTQLDTLRDEEEVTDEKIKEAEEIREKALTALASDKSVLKGHIVMEGRMDDIKARIEKIEQTEERIQNMDQNELLEYIEKATN